MRRCARRGAQPSAQACRATSAQLSGRLTLTLTLAGMQGNQCPYAHGVYERNLHPSKYRTQLCTEGERCSRRVCFFAHSHQQLRMPIGAWSLEEAVRGPALRWQLCSTQAR